MTYGKHPLVPGSDHNLLGNREQGNPHRQYHHKMEPLIVTSGGSTLVCPVTIEGKDACLPILDVTNIDQTNVDGGTQVLRVYRQAVAINKTLDFASFTQGLYIGFMPNTLLYVEGETSVWNHMMEINGQDGTVSFGAPAIYDWGVQMPASFGSRMAFPIVSVDENYTVGDDDYTVALTNVRNVPAAKVWKLENALMTWTDVTVALANDDLAQVQLYDSNNDYLYFGYPAQFNNLQVLLSTLGSSTITPTFSYSLGGSTWSVFAPTDGTAGFTANGTISWGVLGSWATDTVNGAGPYYWVRIERNAAVITTPAVGDRIRPGVLDSTSAPRTITLPLSTGPAVLAGRTVNIKDGSGQVTSATPIRVQRSGGDFIDGSTSRDITVARASWTIQTDGAGNWYVI